MIRIGRPGSPRVPGMFNLTRRKLSWRALLPLASDKPLLVVTTLPFFPLCCLLSLSDLSIFLQVFFPFLSLLLVHLLHLLLCFLPSALGYTLSLIISIYLLRQYEYSYFSFLKAFRYLHQAYLP